VYTTAPIDLLVVRHAQSEGNAEGSFGGHGPTPLSALGREQAQKLAVALSGEAEGEARWSIWSSDLPRAVETARPLCEKLGLEMKKTPALRERDVGVFTGLAFTEAERRYPEIYRALVARDPSVEIPGAETPAACAARAAALCERAIAELDRSGGTSPHRLVLVSHAYAIHLMLRRLLRIAEGSPTIYFQTDNAAVHRVRIAPNGTWTLQAINDRAHL
jgi:broad specificity phosphatase PhoE